MKRSFLYGILLAMFVSIPAMAAVTVEETTDPEYLINGGYSQWTTEEVFTAKNRATSKPIEPLYHKNQNAFVRGLKKVCAYLDPAFDNSEQRLHHDIKQSPSFSDL